jgi:hypothetical protein
VPSNRGRPAALTPTPATDDDRAYRGVWEFPEPDITLK